MSYQRKKRRPVAEINVVPYIDVMLVLLIIFMITTPLITQGVNVDLPKADAKPLSEDSNTPLIASINADGEYFLTVGESQESALSLQEIMVLTAAQLTVEPNTPVMVNGDSKVPYQKVIELMAALNAAGAVKIGLMTETPEQ